MFLKRTLQIVLCYSAFAGTLYLMEWYGLDDGKRYIHFPILIAIVVFFLTEEIEKKFFD